MCMLVSVISVLIYCATGFPLWPIGNVVVQYTEGHRFESDLVYQNFVSIMKKPFSAACIVVMHWYVGFN